MMRQRENHARGLAFHVSLASAIALVTVACTQDFGAYQAGAGDDASTSPEGSTTTGTDGSTSSSGDGAVTPPTDAGPMDAGPDAACTMAATCAATQTTCKSACDATQNTCNQQCGGGGGGGGGGNNFCKQKCKSDRDKCSMGCTTTCHTCAGSGCTTACN